PVWWRSRRWTSVVPACVGRSGVVMPVPLGEEATRALLPGTALASSSVVLPCRVRLHLEIPLSMGELLDRVGQELLRPRGTVTSSRRKVSPFEVIVRYKEVLDLVQAVGSQVV